MESTELKQEHDHEDELSIAVDNALQEMRSNLLICPFCSEEHLFDFSMRQHLKKFHHDEMLKIDSWPVPRHHCIYCNAFFYYASIVPKHIGFAHGKELLDQWLNNVENFQKYQIDKANDPSINLVACSPDLSKLFNELDTCDSIKKFRRADDMPSTPQRTPRSILKKTPFSGKIVILSPESAALKRTINNLKRSASARRELRFDLPPLLVTPPDKNNRSLQALDLNASPNKKKKFWNFFSSRNKSPPPINTQIKRKIRSKACKMSNRSANQMNQMITSTPIGHLDESDEEDGCDELDNSIGSNWKSALKTSSFRPLFLAAERWQCNHCLEKFPDNPALVKHQKDSHRGRITLKPGYRCGQCGTCFFRNRFLVKHCHHQHTPTKY